MELYPLTLEEQAHLWRTLGSSYLPSVAYQVRAACVAGEATATEAPRVQDESVTALVATRPEPPGLRD